MSFLTSLFLRRILPNTLPLITRTVISTGIVGGLYRQPLYRLVPLLLDVFRRGDVAWIVSPLATLIPTVAQLPFTVIKKVLLTAVLYRLVANLLIATLLYPLRTLFADILLMQTPVRDHNWFRTLNKLIYDQITNLLNLTKENVDTIFSFTIDSGWFLAISSAILVGIGCYYKYDYISDFIRTIYDHNPNFINFLKSLGTAGLHTITFIGNTTIWFVKGGYNIVSSIVRMIRGSGITLYNIWASPYYLFKRGFLSIYNHLSSYLLTGFNYVKRGFTWFRNGFGVVAAFIRSLF